MSPDPATHQALLEALSPVRLPVGMATLSWPEIVALLSLGLTLGVLAGLAVLPLTRRRAGRGRARLSDLRALPVPERLLAIARRLGRLPEALRPAAYGAAPPPPDRRIEAIARRARLWRR